MTEQHHAPGHGAFPRPEPEFKNIAEESLPVDLNPSAERTGVFDDPCSAPVDCGLVVGGRLEPYQPLDQLNERTFLLSRSRKQGLHGHGRFQCCNLSIRQNNPPAPTGCTDFIGRDGRPVNWLLRHKKTAQVPEKNSLR
jgi:hypothetical protein